MSKIAYVYKHIYKTSSGQRIQITEKEWGLLALTGDDLTQYQADMAEIEAYEQGLRDSGDWVEETLVETVTVGGTSYNVITGKKVTFPNLTENPTWHANYYNWSDQMGADPNVIYNENLIVDGD